VFDLVTGVVIESFLLLARMAPYLILGLAAAGLLHVLLPMGAVSRLLGGRGAASALRAAALGVPLPLCSCGVVPVAASLKKSGASNGAVVSFLVTTPTSGVDSILATYSLLGFAFAVARVLVSFVIGVLAGVFTSLVERPRVGDPAGSPGAAASVLGQSSGENRAVTAFSYAFDELMGGIARPLLWGTLLGGVIGYILPAGVLGQYVGEGLPAYLAMLAVGVPLYVCASGSIPLAAALMAKGISPGAALIFLIVGPATNAASVSVILNMLGKRALAVYLALIVLGSLAAGWGADAFFAAFPGLVPPPAVAAHQHATGLSLLETASGVVLGLLTLYHVLKPVVARLGRKGEAEMGNRVQLKVSDMTCQHCVRTITGAVSELRGVKNVSADPTTKLVSLDLDEGVDPKAVEKAILDAGYHPEAP
jgi:uncharacterized membrane protein YraQ (UPF0718 family)/copper chaperone CopZ